MKKKIDGIRELGILGIGENFRMLWYVVVLIVSMITNEEKN
jgi:hypothetical protein